MRVLQVCGLFFVVCAVLPTAAHAEPLTLFFVRHAERAPGEDDPSLSEAGAARAEELAIVLADAGIELVLSTDYRRTKETAAAVASALGLPVELYDPRDPGALAELLASRGVRALVVGHSNTTTAAVAAVGGDPGTPIEDATEFSRLYVVTTGLAGATQTVQLRYGDR